MNPLIQTCALTQVKFGPKSDAGGHTQKKGGSGNVWSLWEVNDVTQVRGHCHSRHVKARVTFRRDRHDHGQWSSSTGPPCSASRVFTDGWHHVLQLSSTCGDIRERTTPQNFSRGFCGFQQFLKWTWASW